MNDYIIAVDRDGQPYIAHAWGQRGANANHKYIAKIGEGAKARYFYTQEQLRAFQQGARQGAKNTIDQAKQKTSSLSNKLGEKTGISQRKQFKEAQSRAMKTGKGEDWDKANSARDKYESTKLGKAESKAYKTKSAAENKAWDAVNKAKDKLGVDERERAEKAWENTPSLVRSNDKKAMDAFNKAQKAQDEYRKTPLGKAEYLSERAKEIATGVDGTPKDIAKDLIDRAKSAKAEKKQAKKESLQKDLKEKQAEFDKANSVLEKAEKRAKKEPKYRMTEEYKVAVQDYNKALIARDNIEDELKKLK